MRISRQPGLWRIYNFTTRIKSANQTWPPNAHCFKIDEAKSFTSTGHYQTPATVQQLLFLFLGHFTPELNCVFESKRFGLPFKTCTEIAVTCDPKFG